MNKNDENNNNNNNNNKLDYRVLRIGGVKLLIGVLPQQRIVID